MSNDSERLNRARRLGVGIVAAIGFMLTVTMFTPAVRADGGEQSLEPCTNGSLTNLGERCGDYGSSAPKWSQADDPNVDNSRYREGDGIPYRLAITGLSDGEHSLTISYDFTKYGKFAFDRLTRYDLTQKSDPCADTLWCTYDEPNYSPWDIPGEVASPDGEHPELPKGGNLYTFTDSGFTPGHLSDIPGSRVMTAWVESGTTLTWISMDGHVTQTGLASDKSSRSFSLKFDVSGCGSDCSVMLGWTAHLASSESTLNGGWGAGQGYSSVFVNYLVRMGVVSEYGYAYRDAWPCAAAPGALIVTKHVVGGGPYSAPNFVITVNGQNPSPSSFPGAESPGASVALDLGSYEVIESDSRGYTLSYDGDCSGTIAQGDIKYCTVTNMWVVQGPPPGKIIIIKNARGGDDTFGFTTTGGDGFPPTFSITTLGGTGTVTYTNINTDLTYGVSEDLKVDWALQSVNCVDQNGNPLPNLAFKVPAGGSVQCTFENVHASSAVTDSSLCYFDRDPDLDGSQFRLLLTPNPSSPSSYKVTATNPGQFFYNVFYNSDEPGTVSLYINVPFPYVTQGARPIHVYSSVQFVPVNGGFCLKPGTEIYSSSQTITFSSYDTKDFGNFATVEVTFPNPGTFSYLNIHLDYGLKRSGGWTKGTGISCPDSHGNDAIGPAPWNLLQILNMCDKGYYAFSFSDSDTAPPWIDTQTIQNENAFKHDPGFAGQVTYEANGNGVPNVMVEVYNPKGALIGTVYTDDDGFYSFYWKHTGKAATYTVELPVYVLSQPVLVKSGTIVYVNFQV